MATVFDLTPSLPALVPFVIGWLAGWLAFWRARPLPPPSDRQGPSLAFVIPARDEAGNIGSLAAALHAQLGDLDELVVVDDRSTDGTAALAAAGGAKVVAAPEPPAGWLGKPHACWIGAHHTGAEVLVFVDADVEPAPTMVAKLRSVLAGARPDEVVSIQPWHRTQRAYELLSMPFNILGPMAAGGFALRPSRRALAFGPVLACRRDEYLQRGGHAEPSVRAKVAEDAALGRRFTRVLSFTGRPDVAFRMYPDGVGSLVRGWVKVLAGGATSAPAWAALASGAWLWSLAAGWTVSPWCYVASVIQVGVLAGRVGRFRWAPVLAPIAAVVVAVIVGWSLVAKATGRPVRWKGRSVRV